MRIGLLTTQVPFVTGGAELLAANLRTELIRAGHEAEIISLPFNWYPAQTLVDHIVAGSLLDVSSYNNTPIDLMIGLKFPAYLARHPRKVHWLVHQHRQAYDMWDSGTSDLLHQEMGQAVKGAIDQADRVALGQAPVFTISRNVSRRLQHYCGVPSTPIYHPPPLADLLSPGEYGDYLLVPSRIGPSKRQDLVIEALAKMRRPLDAVFVGKPDDPAWGEALKKRAEKLGLGPRVKWLSGLDGRALAELYAKARAVVFVPVDEDYGYVTLEAMLAGKAVVTVTDAGGPLEFIEHGVSGLVSPPDAVQLARHLDLLSGDRGLAETLGAGALGRYGEMDIGWDAVIDNLLGRPRTEKTSANSTQPRLSPVVLPELEADSEAPPGDADVVTGESEPIRTAGGEAAETSAMASVPADETSDGASGDAVPEVLRVDARVLSEGLPVSSLGEVLSAFDMTGNANPEMFAYLETHWVRYLQTLALIPPHGGGRFLDLGTGEPYGFLALVKLIKPEARFTVVVEDRAQHGRKSVFPSRRGGPPLEVDVIAFNVEVDRFPVLDESFDTVLAMEVLEHLSLNPAHMFHESARALRKGGSMIVTTPNIVSYRSVSLALSGNAPYSFGVFVPFHGYYGRHNREYTPHEVDVLGQMAGFDSDLLITRDVYENYQIGFDRTLMERSDFPLALRGQNTFYRGIKAGEPRLFGQTSLYREDPIEHRARLVARPGAKGGIDLTVTNEGRKVLLAEGPEKTVFNFDVYDSRGTLETYAIELELPGPVEPGRSVTRNLPIAPVPGGAVSLVRASLLLHGRGPLTHCGVPPINIVAAPDAVAVLKSMGKGGQHVVKEGEVPAGPAAPEKTIATKQRSDGSTPQRKARKPTKGPAL